MKNPPDPLERAATEAQDWLFLCPSGALANAIAKIGTYGLNTALWSDKTYRREVRGRKIILVTGESGPDFDAAPDRITKARGAGGTIVRHWMITGLGVGWNRAEEWLGENDIANLFWLDKPWKAEAAESSPATSSRNGSAASPAVPPDDPPIALPDWPAPPGAEAYSGLAGEIVRTIEPESEADPVALLVQLLIAFGNVVGRGPHVAIGGAQHHAHEFAVLVGETSAGRKGTSWSDVRQFVGHADPGWHNARIMGGLSSGEGLIYHVRDPIEGKEPVKKQGKIIEYQDVTVDHGVSDKRMMIVETEFGGVLKALSRDGNKLSAVIRQAWDGDTLASLTKGSPYRATGAHISAIGHITAEELTRLLTQCDQANGLANRFEWVCVRRSRLLPFGGRAAQKDIERLRIKVAEAVEFAREVGAVAWTRESMDLWEAEYPRLTSARPGVFGMVTSRAEAHTVRLALHYTLMDRSVRIELRHLRAALALWDYCERSAAYIFGDALGDKDAQVILDALRAAPAGLTRTEIRRGVFGDNKPATYVAAKLAILLRMRLVRSEEIETGGRHAERWFAIAPYVKNVKNVTTPGPEAPFHVNHVNHVTSDAENPAPDREVFEL